jgi:biotin transport system substrate-specific component
MNQTIPQAIDARIERAQVISNVLLVIAGSAIIALAAQIAIPVPFTPVPLTMQPLAVLLVGAVLGAQRGAAAATLYLLEGASGMPVFAQGHAGAIWLTASTAGFLFSYPFAAFVAGWFSQRRWSVAGMFVGLVVIYAGGWSWLALLTDARSAYAMGVGPFIIADLVKIAFGAVLLPLGERALSER